MPRAFVLFSVESGSEDKVLTKAKNVNGVQEAYISYGVYDIILKVNTNSMEELKELITHSLRKTENVRSTLTLILADE